MAPGPILIFDKSTLQALNLDQANWLDNFFMSNITPLFYIETLADLEKEVKEGQTPEQIVGAIALKTPDMHAHPNAFHLSLIFGELLGYGEVHMMGFPCVAGGTPVIHNGAKAVIYENSPEEASLNRWREHEFLQVEREFAVYWRRQLQAIDLKLMAELFKPYHQAAGRPTDLGDIKTLADSIVDGPDPEKILRVGAAFLTSDPGIVHQIVTRWANVGRPRVRDYAPYFAYVMSVDFFFCLGMAASQIGDIRKSNRVDMAYLYYLPFCMVFTSGDDLQKRAAPLFLRSDQSFIAKHDLKADLKRLDEYYDSLPEEDKAKGMYSFASHPPDDDSFLVTRLWKKHLGRPDSYRKPRADFEGKTILVPPVGSDPEDIMSALNDFDANAEPLPPGSSVSMDELAGVQIKRLVMRKKGKWHRFCQGDSESTD